MLSGANLIYGAGLLEAGISYSHGQLVLDNETFKMVRRLMDGIPVTDETLAVNDILKACPGGNYMGHDLTLKLLRGYHSGSTLFDRQNRSSWDAATGGRDAAARAEEIAADLIAHHRPSVELSDEVKSGLKRLIADAEAEVAEHPEVMV
jgi:trimethylamine--corrinoid protein Co-methyltransferase